jgi:Sulfatase
MVKNRIQSAAVLLITLTVVAVGCSDQAPQGWQPLWQDRWEWGSRGELWVRGVPANGPFEVEPGLGRVVRADLVNLGEQPATVVLSDSKVRRWELDPGQVMPLELEGLTDRARFEAPADVVIANPRAGAKSEEPVLVVFIVIDTLRADHVTTNLMPGVTGYFAGGRRWMQATANASWTLPSVASFFSSRPVLDLTAPSGDLIGIPAGVTTWSTELEAAGFTGAAVVANYSLSVLNGFAEGFASYQAPDGHGSAEHPDARWAVDAGRKWLERHRGENAFLYLHLMDPHFPYRDHKDPAVKAPDLPALAAGQRKALPGERELLAKLYAGEVRHVDGVLTELLHELPEDAVVVLTSDHGESLGERGCWGHGLNLFQESLRVPLLIRGPGITPGIVNDPVQHLDLTPTLLDLVGIPVPVGMVGRSLLDGGSQRPIVSSTFGAGPLRWSWRHGHAKVLLRMAEQPGLGVVARSKMLGGGRREPGAFAYDLEVDPIEVRPDAVPPALVEPVTRAFVETAGRMVPGLQIGLVRRDGPISTRLVIEGQSEIVQAWSGAPMTADLSDGRLELSCEDAFPLCLLAVAVEPDSASISTEDGVDRLDELGSPDSLSDGLTLWWNPARPLIVGGYDETLDRLRALGYIE